MLFSNHLNFLLATSGLGQSISKEPEGMQALVAEVRLLRKDLQATNGYALKAQILLQRLQFQRAAVARVSERLNDVRGRLLAELFDVLDHIRIPSKEDLGSGKPPS